MSKTALFCLVLVVAASIGFFVWRMRTRAAESPKLIRVYSVPSGEYEGVISDPVALKEIARILATRKEEVMKLRGDLRLELTSIAKNSTILVNGSWIKQDDGTYELSADLSKTVRKYVNKNP